MKLRVKPFRGVKLESVMDECGTQVEISVSVCENKLPKGCILKFHTV